MESVHSHIPASESSEIIGFSQLEPVASAHQLGLGEAYCLSVPAPDREGDPSEDAATLVSWRGVGWVLAVADGVGGSANGAQASKVALKELAAAVKRSSEKGTPPNLREAVLKGFDRANRAVLALGNGAATTLTVATVEEHLVRGYQVGDSTMLLVGLRGKLKYKSLSHSPVGYGVEAGLIDAREALHHEARHIVSNVVGSTAMSVQMGPKLTLARHDTLLLSSDGLSDNFYVDEIVERVRKGPLVAAAASLRADAHKRMTTPSEKRPHKPDDLTMLMYRRLQ